MFVLISGKLPFDDIYSDWNNCNIIKDLCALFLVFDWRQLTKVSDQNIVRTFRVHGLFS